jgi:hypothetical protein
LYDIIKSIGIYEAVKFLSKMYPEILLTDIHEIIDGGISNGKINEQSALGKILKEIAQKDREIYDKYKDTIIERISIAAELRQKSI